MKSIKAVLVGSLIILVVMMLVQLAFIFLVVGYHYLARHFPFLNEITLYFRYLVGYPIFFMVLFAGGYITAGIAEKRVWLPCLLVGLITVGLSMLSALSYMALTLTGVLTVLLALLAITAGGGYWQKAQSGAG